MKIRSLRVQERNRNLNLIQMYLVLLLVGRNRILQVPRSSATDARKPTPKDMKMSAKHRMPSAMHVVQWAIMKLLVKSLVTFLRNLLLIHRNQDPQAE